MTSTARPKQRIDVKRIRSQWGVFLTTEVGRTILITTLIFTHRDRHVCVAVRDRVRSIITGELDM